MIFKDAGELGVLMRGHDWSASPLGYPDTWPQNLRMAVSMMLPNKHVMFVAWGPELALLYNDACRPIFGNKHPWALGRPFREVWSEVWDEIEPLVETALGGTATWSEDLPLILERNGFPDDCWFTFSYSPLRDDSGKIAGVFCAAAETTERVLTERRLMAEREQLQNEFLSLYELAPGFIATSQGPEHRITFANASYRAFVGRERLVGMTVKEAMPEIIEQGFIVLLDQVYRTGEPFFGKNMPIGFVSKVTGNIEIRYCDFVYEAVRDSKNAITGLFCEGYDVTAQREAADKLSALQADLIHVSRVNAMGTMAATLAHELNQPLSAITNYTAGLLRTIDPKVQQTDRLLQALQGINEASQRAAEIIRNLRELTRRREPARAAFDLKPAVSECARLVKATIPPTVQLVEDIPEVLAMAADRVQIQQVVINLLRNACDAVLASERQVVTINARRQDGNLLVSVIDTGPGVPVEVAERIFSWSDSSKESGMGLGLSICRTIVEAHRGKIWLENSGSHGSEFCFSVPLPMTEVDAGLSLNIDDGLDDGTGGLDRSKPPGKLRWRN